MRILIDLSSRLIGEAVRELLLRFSDRIESAVSGDAGAATMLLPHKVLVDARTLAHNHQARWPDTKLVLIDTGLSEEKIISLLYTHKLHGIIATDMTPELFMKAIEAIHAGQVWIDNRKIKALLHNADTARHPNGGDSLSKREREIVILVAQGLKNREIAQRLCVSEPTIKAHLSHIFKKCNVVSRAQLVPLALKFRNQPI